MINLLQYYNQLSIVNVADILPFHHQFELIPPFQDGNGGAGRIIMLRESLLHQVTPFIIPSDRREKYIHGLKRYNKNASLFK